MTRKQICVRSDHSGLAVTSVIGLFQRWTNNVLCIIQKTKEGYINHLPLL